MPGLGAESGLPAAIESAVALGITHPAHWAKGLSPTVPYHSLFWLNKIKCIFPSTVKATEAKLKRKAIKQYAFSIIAIIFLCLYTVFVQNTVNIIFSTVLCKHS